MIKNDEIMDSEGNLRFKCDFSKTAIRNNSLTVVAAYFFLLILPCIYVGVSLNRIPGLLAVSAFFILLLVCTLRYMNNIKESYLEITMDGNLRCVYKGRKTVSYPIDKIKDIEKSSLEEAAKRYARLTVVINTRGWEVYGNEGVLITFDRKWIKSVYPIYFNPAEADSFITAIRDRIVLTTGR